MVDAKNPITLMVSLLAAAVLCGAGPAASAAPASSMPSGARQKPNFIFILTDDLDVKSVEFMPRLKALLTKQGTTFSDFFVTDSICCPSRASFLRGQYPHNHQVLTNSEPEGGFERFRNIVNSVNAGVVTHLSKRLGELKHCVADNCREHSPKLL
jgi:N-acetylglucosamine-6-sulfatase